MVFGLRNGPNGHTLWRFWWMVLKFSLLTSLFSLSLSHLCFSSWCDDTWADPHFGQLLAEACNVLISRKNSVAIFVERRHVTQYSWHDRHICFWLPFSTFLFRPFSFFWMLNLLNDSWNTCESCNGAMCMEAPLHLPHRAIHPHDSGLQVGPDEILSKSMDTGWNWESLILLRSIELLRTIDKQIQTIRFKLQLSTWKMKYQESGGPY